jgi:hypothetical protein
MLKNIRKPFTAELIDYLIDEYFDDDIKRFCARTTYTAQQVEFWRRGTKKPHAATLRWLLSTTLAPEFAVACEFKKVDLSLKKNISKELNGALGGHGDKIGVYAFYDSMCNVIYVGKASTSLKAEMYQQLRLPLGLPFPKAVKTAPKERWQATSYVSAYEIPRADHLDYPKHVESLALRLSKPVGNKVLGTLVQAKPPIEKK